jgi:hypothetical protein
MSGGLPEALGRLTLQLGRLRISYDAGAEAAPRATAPAPTVQPPARGVPLQGGGDAPTKSEEDLEGWDLVSEEQWDFVPRLARGIRDGGGLSAEGRILRAHRGRAAKVRPTSPCGLRRKEAYVALLGPGLRSPRWTRTYSAYLRISGGALGAATQGHSFASQAEAEAYCLGAGLPCLPKEAQ